MSERGNARLCCRAPSTAGEPEVEPKADAQRKCRVTLVTSLCHLLPHNEFASLYQFIYSLGIQISDGPYKLADFLDESYYVQMRVGEDGLARKPKYVR